MGTGKKRGGTGGGTALNFKVLAYATEEALLADAPKENTIGIITDVDITGYYFIETEPEGMSEGEVWITTGASSAVEFNALKKNAVQVYPLYAKQYVDGAWVHVTAMIYQGGAWAEWILYLYNKGVYQSISGFSLFAYGPSTSGSTRVKPTITNGTTYIKLSIAQSTNTTAAGSGFSNRTVDLTNYSKLKIQVTAATSEGTEEYTNYIRFGVSSTRADEFEPAVVKTICKNGDDITSDTVFSCDISSLSGKYYVFVTMYGCFDQSVTFNQLWLE